jgi:hypothetical protein
VREIDRQRPEPRQSGRTDDADGARAELALRKQHVDAADDCLSGTHAADLPLTDAHRGDGSAAYGTVTARARTHGASLLQRSRS